MLLSKIPGNRTVGFRRSKKGKRSTWSRLRVDPGFVEFPQTPRGRSFSLLVFIPFLRVFPCFGWFEAVRGRLIGPKAWDRIVTKFLSQGAAVAALGAVWSLIPEFLL